jgi:predicted ATP-grasp superfamily ATP-dependent carboligase
LGVDFKRDLAFRSHYFEPHLCPNPLEDTDGFLAVLGDLARGHADKPVLFVTSDDFLLPVSRNRDRIAESYRLLLPPPDVIEAIEDKHRQVTLAASAGIPVPRTFAVEDPRDIERVAMETPLPAFIKARHVTSWRTRVSTSQKGFVVKTREELVERLRVVAEMGVPVLVQELIPGPDTNHFKASAYFSSGGQPLLAFGLRKIRQCPPGAGFGCLVESFHDADLMTLGIGFLRSIGYRGVGSVEFKLDPRDRQLKLIELNPRYWQQVALAERCGMNFPLVHYLDLTGREPSPSTRFQEGVKWLNLHRDIDAFRIYRRRGELSTLQWLRSLRGPRISSCFAWDDVSPGTYALLGEPVQRIRHRLFGPR